MSTQSNSNLQTRVTQLRAESAAGANTAIRVGTLLQDLLDSVPLEWDSTRPYPAGRWVIFTGRLIKSFSPTTAGQSPLTHPAKWTDKTVRSKSALLTDGENLPVTSQAVIEYVTDAIAGLSGGTGGVGLASESVAGISKRASEIVALALVDNGSFITPLTLGKVLAKVLENLNPDIVLSNTAAAGNYLALKEREDGDGLVVGDVPAPTLRSLGQDNPNVDLTLRFDGILQLEQPYVENIQAIPTVFDTGQVVNGRKIFNTAWFRVQTLIELIAGAIGLPSVLAVKNTSTGTGVFGGLGLFRRGSTTNATRLMGLLPAKVEGKDADYLEPVEFVDVLQNGANALTAAQKQQFISTIGLVAQQPFTGTTTGNRCEEDAEPPAQVLSTRTYGLVDAVDGQVLGHPFGNVDLVASFYVLSGPKAYRPFYEAYIRDVTEFNFTLEFTAGSDPFTGRLEIKPATPTA